MRPLLWCVIAVLRRSARRGAQRTLLAAAASAWGASAWSASPPATPSCSVSTASTVNFGIYDVFAAAANTGGVGNFTIRCSSPATHYVLALSTGLSGRFGQRMLSSGASALRYNLYTSAARSTIWGDGTGGSSTVNGSANGTTRLDVFGLIPARQDVAVGSYSDRITVTLEF